MDATTSSTTDKRGRESFFPPTTPETADGSPGKKTPDPLREAIARTRDWLLDRQHEDGYWCGELEGDSILQSEYILLLAWLGREQNDAAIRAGNYLVQQQMPTGGWNQYPDGPLEISGSVKAYFALKLTGHNPQAEYMCRAHEAIRAAGGADRVNSFTRFYLALLGQIDYRHCPAVPPEMVLLPTWLPIHLYRISAWSRTIFVPLSIMWDCKPVRELPDELGIAELFIEPPERWPALSCPGANASRRWITWERTFRLLDRTIKLFDRWRLRIFRKRALRVAQQWILNRFEDSDGLGAIFPGIIWSIVALRCLGYEEDAPEIQSCLNELEKLSIDEGETRRLQPCASPVWDTTITLRALAAAGVNADDERASRGVDWLLSKEVRTHGDWSETVNAEPGGWFFEHRNAFYPDVDDTVMALLAMHDQHAAGGFAGNTKSAMQRAIDWTLAMQNRDGGWGAFDRNNDAEFLCHVPFADHNAMIDPSTPDLTARVMEALAACGFAPTHPAIQRAISYLRKTQQPDGSWLGRWGVNYIYGTWQSLVGLAAGSFAPDDPMITHGANWLIDHQQPSGAWGESPASYEDPSLRGKGPPTPSQTAWAILGLIAAGQGRSEAVQRGVSWLLDTQNGDGTWDEAEFTGTGFPRVFYLKYHYYRIYFPLLALCAFRDEMK